MLKEFLLHYERNNEKWTGEAPVLGSMSNPFIAITPRSTLLQGDRVPFIDQKELW